MSDKILDTVKETLNVLQDNVGFDRALLVYLNAIRSMLSQLGVTELDSVIDEETVWPTFASDALGGLVRLFFSIKAKLQFDPSASDSMNRLMSESLVEVEGRIMYEVEASNV